MKRFPVISGVLASSLLVSVVGAAPYIADASSILDPLTGILHVRTIAEKAPDHPGAFIDYGIPSLDWRVYSRWWEDVPLPQIESGYASTTLGPAPALSDHACGCGELHWVLPSWYNAAYLRVEYWSDFDVRGVPKDDFPLSVHHELFDFSVDGGIATAMTSTVPAPNALALVLAALPALLALRQARPSGQ